MDDRNDEAPSGAGQLTRRDFGGMSTQRESIATQAMVAQARAAVEARYTMAMHRPRRMEMVRDVLLKECRRPQFAEEARYRKPIGDGVEGPSIRFAEAAARAMGNFYTEEFVVYEDEMRIVIRVSATDLESNVTYPRDVRIDKTLERRHLKKGQKPIAQRVNSFGDTVYIVAAVSEDELADKIGAKVSKALRTCLLRLIPGDLVAEGQGLCIATMEAAAKGQMDKDPVGEKRRICDSFSGAGVSPAELEKWLGHGMDTISAAELVDLRKAFVTLRDGEGSWVDILESRMEVLAERVARAAQAAAKVAPKPAAPPPQTQPAAEAATPPVAPAVVTSATTQVDLAAQVEKLRVELEAAKADPAAQQRAAERAEAEGKMQVAPFDKAATDARARDAAREAAAIAERQRAAAPPPGAKGTSAAKAAIAAKKASPAQQSIAPQNPPVEVSDSPSPVEGDAMAEPGWMSSDAPDPV